jgi:hypothetical protein
MQRCSLSCVSRSLGRANLEISPYRRQFHWRQQVISSSRPSFIAGPSLQDDKNEREIQRLRALPRISLVRSFQTEAPAKKYSSTVRVEDAPLDSTFRQRVAKRTRGSRKAARKGARSATEMIQKYGPVFIGTYLTVYVSTLGSLYIGVESGVLDPAYLMSWVAEDEETTKSTVHLVAEFMEHYSWTKQYAPLVEQHPGFANLGVAWIATKFTEPLRLGATALIVPRLARRFGYVVDESEGDDHEPVAEDEKASSSTTTTTAASSEPKKP